MRKVIYSTLLLLTVLLPVKAQHTSMLADYGVSTSVGKASLGYTLSFGMMRQTKGRALWGIDVDHIFNSSKQGLPDDLAAEQVTIRTVEYPRPYEINTFWDETDFHGHQFQAKPNRYFNFNINATYYHPLALGAKIRVLLGGGLTLSYRDEMEVIGLVNLDQLHIPFPGPVLILNDRKVPIYHYDTYMDIALTPRVLLSYELSDRIRLGLNQRLYTYLFSGNVVYTSSLSVAMNLKGSASKF